MALGDNTYSRVIAWLKILLPLAALGLLSTIFLLSRSLSPTGDIPVSETGLRDRAQEQRVTAAHFTGTTREGAALTLTARSARPDPDDSDRALAEVVDARIVQTDGTEVTLKSAEALVDQPADLIDMFGGVTFGSSAGYLLETERLQSGLASIRAQSDGEVRGSGPAGQLVAGQMRLTTDEAGDMHLLFTDGVKLIYDPKQRD